MSSTDEKAPAQEKPEENVQEKKRYTVDLRPKDRARLEELTAIMDDTSCADTFRTCLRIVYHQAKFIRAAEGNRICMVKADGQTELLLPFETLVLRK